MNKTLSMSLSILNKKGNFDMDSDQGEWHLIELFFIR